MRLSGNPGHRDGQWVTGQMNPLIHSDFSDLVSFGLKPDALKASPTGHLVPASGCSKVVIWKFGTGNISDILGLLGPELWIDTYSPGLCIDGTRSFPRETGMF